MQLVHLTCEVHHMLDVFQEVWDISHHMIQSLQSIADLGFIRCGCKAWEVWSLSDSATAINGNGIDGRL